MRLLAAALVSTSALLAPRAPSPRKTITRTTRRHAVDADDIERPARATDVPVLGRRAAVAAFTLSLTQTANAVEFVQPATADDRAPTLNWAGGTPFSATAKQIVDAYYGLEFVTYLSRFLLNFDADCAAWWAQQERAVPASYDKRKRTAFLAAKFGTFTSSVEYGLRRYPGSAGRKALLDKLTQQHGFDPERRRHLALAFTLLAPERQPVQGIKDLLVGVPVYGKRGGGVGALLPPACHNCNRCMRLRFFSAHVAHFALFFAITSEDGAARVAQTTPVLLIQAVHRVSIHRHIQLTCIDNINSMLAWQSIE
mgnify:CR=1 FL=1